MRKPSLHESWDRATTICVWDCVHTVFSRKSPQNPRFVLYRGNWRIWPSKVAFVSGWHSLCMMSVRRFPLATRTALSQELNVELRWIEMRISKAKPFPGMSQLAACKPTTVRKYVRKKRGNPKPCICLLCLTCTEWTSVAANRDRPGVRVALISELLYRDW